MNKIFGVLLIGFLGFILVGCKTNSNNMRNGKIIDYHSFRGTIVEVYSNNNFLVECNEDSNLIDKIIVQSNDEIMWEIGTEVVVIYAGDVMYSDPPQVIAIDVFETNEDDIVRTKIKDGTLKNTGLTLIIINHTNREYSYGESYDIEYMEKGKWFKVKTVKDPVFTSIGHTLKANQIVIRDYNWKNIYGELAAGTYRINKKNNDTISVEFTIN